MANEIKITASVTVEKGSLKYDFRPGQVTADLATARRGGHIQSIGETAEALDVGDVAAPSFCILRNLDATNPCLVGPQNGTTSSLEVEQSIPAGKFSILWLDSGTVLMAQGSGGTVSLQVDVFET